jgi:hypothetical protein
MNLKNRTQILAVNLALLMGALLVACDDMSSIQREYASREEQIYLGKVDSIRFNPGFGKVKLKWYIPSDPKIDRTVIYWNQRRDSIVKEFVRDIPGIQKDSITIENLNEGSMLFEFRNTSKEGYTSLLSSLTATIWGPNFANGLRARTLAGFEYDYHKRQYQLGFSPTAPSDGVVYTEIRYTNQSGAEQLVKVGRESNTVTLNDFPDGTEFSYRTVFFPSQGIDTVYNSFATHKSPIAVIDPGTPATIVGSDTTKFFDRNGQRLYEWNAKGDILVHQSIGNGQFAVQESYPALVPRTTYRDFFFYDDDKFIGIGTNNSVYMLQITNGKLVNVRTPAGADVFGTGFTFPQFIPGIGYIFSVSAAGEVKTWLAKNNATWGTPNGTTVGTNYNTFKMLTLFGNRSLLGVDADGNLWATAVTVDGALGTRSRIGEGWGRFERLVSFGNDLIAVDADGNTVVFENFSVSEKYWIVDES